MEGLDFCNYYWSFMNVVYKIAKYADQSIVAHLAFILTSLKTTTVLKIVNLDTITHPPFGFAPFSALIHIIQYFRISHACHAKAHVKNALILQLVILVWMAFTCIRINALFHVLRDILTTQSIINVIVVFFLVKLAPPILIASHANLAT